MIISVLDRVCSFENSVKLSELHVRQDSMFKWVLNNKGKPFIDFTSDCSISGRSYAAYTLSELAYIVPQLYCNINKCTNSVYEDFYIEHGEWLCGKLNKECSADICFVYGRTPADTLALLLIKLIEKEVVEWPESDQT